MRSFEFILNILNVSSLSCVQVKCLRDYQTGSSEQKLLRIWSTRDLLCKCLRQIKGEGTATHRESCKSTICEESWEGQGRKALQHSAVLSKFQSGLQECHSDCSPQRRRMLHRAVQYSHCVWSQAMKRQGWWFCVKPEVDPEVKVSANYAPYPMLLLQEEYEQHSFMSSTMAHQWGLNLWKKLISSF